MRTEPVRNWRDGGPMTADQLLAQLTFHWDSHLRPKLAGLTDHEYGWEPAPGCWGIRRRGDVFVPDFTFPEPEPAPVTTIAWRLGHIWVGIFGMRNAAHFGGPAIDYQTAVWPGTAAGMLAELDAAYARWVQGVAALSAGDLARPVGPAEGPYADLPMSALVLHINREVIHHGAEVLLLRDLYRSRAGATA